MLAYGNNIMYAIFNMNGEEIECSYLKGQKTWCNVDKSDFTPYIVVIYSKEKGLMKRAVVM